MKEKKEWRPLPDFITIKESKIEGLGILNNTIKVIKSN